MGIKSANREISEGKANLWPMFLFLPTRRANKERRTGKILGALFRDEQGFGRLDADLRANVGLLIKKILEHGLSTLLLRMLAEFKSIGVGLKIEKGGLLNCFDLICRCHWNIVRCGINCIRVTLRWLGKRFESSLLMTFVDG